MSDGSNGAPIALVTGVSRAGGIGLAIAERLAGDGFTVASAGWRPYDERMPWGADETPPQLPGPVFDVDLAEPDGPTGLVDAVVTELGPVSVLVMCHCESVDSEIRTTTIESFDRHMAVNARAVWLLVKAFAEQFPGPAGTGRIVALTSDDTAFNLPYGASKGALDRIVLAAASELADLGVTANVINPGPVDTGWMDDEIADAVRCNTLQGRLGRPSDTANLVSFLCSTEGQWINRQLLYSDGGRRR